MASDDGADDAHRGLLKSPQDFAAGLFLIFFAILLYSQAAGLRFGQLRGIGPGLMPQMTAILLGTFGLVLVFLSTTTRGALLTRWSLRGLFFVLGAVLLFAMTVRGASFPALGITIPSLGLLVAGPLAVIVASLADRDTRPVEVILYAIGINIFCGLLFKELLRLPIPYDPQGLIPAPINTAYMALRSLVIANGTLILGVLGAALFAWLAYVAVRGTSESVADGEGK